MSLHTGVSPSGLRHGTLTPIFAGSNPATPAIAARWGSPREIITRWIHNAAQQARRWPALGIPQDHRLKTLYPQCPRRTRHNAAIWARKRDSRHAAIYDGAAFTGALCCETAKWSLTNSHHQRKGQADIDLRRTVQALHFEQSCSACRRKPVHGQFG